MYLIDSNIIIYSYFTYPKLRVYLVEKNCFVSEITRIEVLGYHKLSKEEKNYFIDVFSLVPIILPNQTIYDEALHIRRKFNLKLGDSLIAATALVNKLTIYTRNLKDFEKIKGLNCLDPLK